MINTNELKNAKEKYNPTTTTAKSTLKLAASQPAAAAAEIAFNKIPVYLRGHLLRFIFDRSENIFRNNSS